MGDAAQFDRDLMVQSLAESESRLRALDERASDMIYRFRLLPEPAFEYVSGAVEAITGWTAEDFYADPAVMFKMLHSDDRHFATEWMANPTDQLHRLRLRLLHRDGHWVWTEHCTVPVLDEQGVLVATEAIARDISEQVQTEMDLRESERIARSVLESIPGPSAVLDAAGVISIVNAAWGEYMAASGADPDRYTVGTDYVAACDEAVSFGVDGAAAVAAGVRAVLAGAQKSFQIAYPAAGKDDHRWFSMDISPMPTAPGGAVVLHSDITERKRHEEQLRHQALHDVLTGLPNRALLLDRLGGALGRAGRDGQEVGVLMLDFDGFKSVNDKFGHAAGDEVLVAMSARMRTLVRPGDTVARLGGDEFVVLCEALGDPAEAAVVAKRIVSGLSVPIERERGDLRVTASVGVAVGGEGIKREALLRDADTAMYHAKSRGKNRFELFDTGLLGRALARLSIEDMLEQGIENKEFRLFYQPIVEISTGTCVGMEALLRWQHPIRGLLAPDEFLAVAEETRLIIPIGDWVVREACAQRQRWQRSHTELSSLPISVNVATQQMQRTEFAQEVTSAIANAGIPAHEIVLELTERSLMDASVVPNALALHEAGVSLSVDDFGIGYSSLTYLKTLPVDQLKIDQSFINGLVQDPVDAAIVTAVVSMTRALGITAVAEGIETEQQRDALVALGCDLGQGFLYARPAPPDQIEEWLDAAVGDPASVGSPTVSRFPAN